MRLTAYYQYNIRDQRGERHKGGRHFFALEMLVAAAAVLGVARANDPLAHRWLVQGI